MKNYCELAFREATEGGAEKHELYFKIDEQVNPVILDGKNAGISCPIVLIRV